MRLNFEWNKLGMHFALWQKNITFLTLAPRLITENVEIEFCKLFAHYHNEAFP